MRSACHMSIQGVDIFEVDIAVAAAELGSVDLGPEMLLKCSLAIKNAVTLRAEAVPRKGAVVFQNVITLAFLSTVSAELDSNRILGIPRVFAVMSTYMRGEVPTSSSMLFQVDFVAISATTKAVED